MKQSMEGGRGVAVAVGSTKILALLGQKYLLFFSGSEYQRVGGELQLQLDLGGRGVAVDGELQLQGGRGVAVAVGSPSALLY